MTQDELKRQLKYRPDTGEFIWLIEPPYRCGQSKGDIADRIYNNGYSCISISGKQYSAHRLVWLYVYGYFPENDIDHINRIKHDNRLCNLREATKSCNSRNRKTNKNSKSGVTGVHLDTKLKRWRAVICVNGTDIYLYSGHNKIHAVRARHNAEVAYNWKNCNSTSSTYLWLKERNLL